MSGIDATGFVTRTLQESLTDIETKEKAEIDPALNVEPEQPIGQVNGIVAAEVRAGWELGEALYNAMDPDKAEGVPLDNLCSLTGTTRDPATKTVVAATVNLDALTVLPAGTKASVAGHADQVFELVTGVTAGGSGNYAATFRAVTAGPIPVAIGTLTVRVTTVTGWNSVTNAVEGTIGKNVETDTSLRKKRVEELTGSGNGTPDAIRTKLLKVAGVAQAVCYENTGDTTDANGIPGHGIFAVIFDGTSPAADTDEVSAALWKARAAGTPMLGDTHTTVDTLGVTQTVKWSRAAFGYLQVAYGLTVTSEYGGADTVKAAIDAWVTENQVIGADVVALAIKAIPLSVPGVVDVTSFAFEILESLPSGGAPVNTANVTMGLSRILVYAATEVTVVT